VREKEIIKYRRPVGIKTHSPEKAGIGCYRLMTVIAACVIVSSMQLIEKYFGIGPGLGDRAIEALVLVMLFMLITTVALWVGKNRKHKRVNRN
jgi:hypothetical protein